MDLEAVDAASVACSRIGVTCDTLVLSVNKYTDAFRPGATFESAGNPVNKITEVQS
jgi:hypothetical protein